MCIYSGYITVLHTDTRACYHTFRTSKQRFSFWILRMFAMNIRTKNVYVHGKYIDDTDFIILLFGVCAPAIKRAIVWFDGVSVCVEREKFPENRWTPECAILLLYHRICSQNNMRNNGNNWNNEPTIHKILFEHKFRRWGNARTLTKQCTTINLRKWNCIFDHQKPNGKYHSKSVKRKWWAHFMSTKWLVHGFCSMNDIKNGTS